MKRALITLLVLLTAVFARAADLTASWEIDFGWAGNFSDEYTMAAEKLELTLASGLGSYNQFRTELELENLGTTPRYVGWNSFILTTDLAGYLGLREVALIWGERFRDPRRCRRVLRFRYSRLCQCRGRQGGARE